MLFRSVQALRHGVRSFLGEEGEGQCAVAAPPVARAEVAAFEERLVGDLEIETLAELRSVEAAVAHVVDCLRLEMDTVVGETHPAHEGAVAAYFDYAHSLSVLQRLRETGSEMEAMIEVMTGRAVDVASSRGVRLAD